MQGRFITFEGNECAGKTTQIQLLADALRGLGREVTVLREPGGTPLAEEIREIVKRPRAEAVYPETELFLFQAARCQLVRNVIKPALAAGRVVLSDRFHDSTWVYQGWVGGLGLLPVEFANTLSTMGLAVDRTFLLHLPVEVLKARLATREGKGDGDRFEQKGEAFFVKVNQAYDELATLHRDRIVKIPADDTAENISRSIQEETMKIL